MLQSTKLMKRLLLPLLAALALPTALFASNKGSIKDTCVQYQLNMINETEAMKRLGLSNIIYSEARAPDEYYRIVGNYCRTYRDWN